MENNESELERILEEGISRYSENEPLAGLEERIMARVRATERKRGSTAGWWTVLAVGLAVLAVGGPIYLRPGRTESRPERIVSEATKPRLDKTPTRMEETRASVRRDHREHLAALPKLAVFPTPSPLTAEERGLLALVKQDPEGVPRAFDSLRKRGSEPLEIAPLVIPPLESGEEQ